MKLPDAEDVMNELKGMRDVIAGTCEGAPHYVVPTAMGLVLVDIAERAEKDYADEPASMQLFITQLASIGDVLQRLAGQLAAKIGVAEHTCPHCKTTHDASTPNDASQRRPIVGDPSICADCGEVMIFDSTDKPGLLCPRPSTPEDLAKFPSDMLADIERVSQEIRRGYKLRGSPPGK